MRRSLPVCRLFPFAALCAVLMLAGAVGRHAAAQDAASGQFWVRAFEDRNGNSTPDPGEPVITGGLGVSLLNADDIVIATALLDGSPYAAQGQIGFQFLPPGEYTLIVAAPEFEATTETRFTRQIAAGTIPLTVEFGGQRIDLAALTGAAAVAAEAGGSLFGVVPVTNVQRAEVGRIALAALAAVLVIGVMFFVGLFIYAGLLRAKYRREMAALRERYATGDTGAYSAATGDYSRTATGAQPPVDARR